MAKRKSHRRKKNPMRTTGAILVENPKRRKHSKRRKNASKSKAHKGKKHTIYGSVKKHTRRVKNPRKRKSSHRRKNHISAFAMRHPGARPFRYARWASAHPAAAAHLAARNPKRKKHHKRRKNAIQVNRRRRNPAIVSSAQSMIRGLPLIGGFLADVVGLAVPALLGAVGVEPTMQILKYVGPYVPKLPASIAYAGTGLLLAGLVLRFAPLDSAMKKDLAIALVSGGGAVGYYKWRTKTDAKMAGELGTLHGFGALELNPFAGLLGDDDMSGLGALDYQDAGYGDGGAYAVVPFGDASGSLGVIELHDAYSGASLADAYSAPDDLSYGEIQVALHGASAWGRSFGRKRLKKKHHHKSKDQSQSDGAGEHGHRWGWLIKIIGFERFQKLAALPEEQRHALIAQLKSQAISTVDAQLGEESASGSASMAGPMMAGVWGSTHIFGM